MKRLVGWTLGKQKLADRDMLEAIPDYLQRVDMFRDLSREEISALFEGVMLRQCPAGTVLFTPDHPSEQLFVLKEGQVELYRLTPGGKRLLTRRIGPNTVFGEMGLLGQSLQGCFAEATEDSLVCVATREDIQRLLTRRPDVALRLLESIGTRLKLLEERLEQAMFSPVRTRLARFLLSSAGPNGVVHGYTHAQIGDAIGALRQTVTEALGQMQSQGLVEVKHRWIKLKDLTQLEVLAGKGR